MNLNKAPMWLQWIIGLFCIFILWAIISPTCARPIYSRRIPTLTNAKNLGIGMLIYCTDSDGLLPPAAGWMSHLYPYVKSDAPFSNPLIYGEVVPLATPADKELMERYPEAQRQGIWGFAFDVRLGSTKIDDKQSARIMLYESTNTSWNATDPFTSYRIENGGWCAICSMDTHARKVLKDKLKPGMEEVQ